MSDYHRHAASYLPSYGTMLEPFVAFYRAWRRRRRFARLRDLSDHQLNDIGVTRHDVEWGLSLPIRENAALRVRQEASQSRRPTGARKITAARSRSGTNANSAV